MAGTVIPTSVAFPDGLSVISLAWTSDGAGAVSGNPASIPNGTLVQTTCIPGGGGTQPTDLYDMTLKDANGADVLGGAGTDLSNATGKNIIANPPLYLVGQTLDVNIAAAGAAKTGTIKVHIRRLK